MPGCTPLAAGCISVVLSVGDPAYTKVDWISEYELCYTPSQIRLFIAMLWLYMYTIDDLDKRLNHMPRYYFRPTCSIFQKKNLMCVVCM